MTAPEPLPASDRALRAALAALPAADRLPWLMAMLRRPPPEAEAAWHVVHFLAFTPHLDLLRQVCRALLEERATQAPALALLVRLHNRAEEWDQLRALVLRALRSGMEGAGEHRRELLRCELLAPSADAAEREAIWHLCGPALSPLARLSHAVQARVARGEPPDAEALLAVLESTRKAILAEGLPAPLARLAEARTVALVGNGSGLAGSGAAAAIEAHDFVVRLNYPVMTGYEADIGRRTDLMLFTEAKRRRMTQLLAREPGYPELPAFGIHITLDPDAAVAGPPRMAPRMTDPLGAVGYERPSTGFLAILLVALLLRRPLTLYGFDFFQPGQRGHYFGGANGALRHELTYERWFTSQVLPLLCPTLRGHPVAG